MSSLSKLSVSARPLKPSVSTKTGSGAFTQVSISGVQKLWSSVDARHERGKRHVFLNESACMRMRR